MEKIVYYELIQLSSAFIKAGLMSQTSYIDGWETFWQSYYAP